MAASRLEVTELGLYDSYESKDKMRLYEVSEMLSEQLRLLAEQSKKADVTELCQLTGAMSDAVNIFVQCKLYSAIRPCDRL